MDRRLNWGYGAFLAVPYSRLGVIRMGETTANLYVEPRGLFVKAPQELST